MVRDYSREVFEKSRFLFTLAGDYHVTPEPTRRRYEKFLKESEQSITPLIEVFNLPESGETRLMFNSDFASPQLPVLRKILEDHDLTLQRAYWEPYLGAGLGFVIHLHPVCRRRIDPKAGGWRGRRSARILWPLPSARLPDLYLQGQISFQEMLFAGNAIDFTHMFIFKESDNVTDREILENPDQQGSAGGLLPNGYKVPTSRPIRHG